MVVNVEDQDTSTAFDAMLIFLEDYWTRGEKSSDDIAVLLGSLARIQDGLPVDRALWEDWKKAYIRAKSNSGGYSEVSH